MEVFLGTYGCWGVLPTAVAARWHSDLRSWYGGAARVAHAEPVARDASTTQADLLAASLAPLLLRRRRRGAMAFGAVLLWRFDLAAPAPIAGASPTPGDFLSRGFTSVAQVGYDLGWSLPSTLLPCFSEIVGRAAPLSCWGREATGLQAIGCSALLAYAGSGAGGGGGGGGGGRDGGGGGGGGA